MVITLSGMSVAGMKQSSVLLLIKAEQCRSKRKKRTHFKAYGFGAHINMEGLVIHWQARMYRYPGTGMSHCSDCMQQHPSQFRRGFEHSSQDRFRKAVVMFHSQGIAFVKRESKMLLMPQIVYWCYSGLVLYSKVWGAFCLTHCALLARSFSHAGMLILRFQVGLEVLQCYILFPNKLCSWKEVNIKTVSLAPISGVTWTMQTKAMQGRPDRNGPDVSFFAGSTTYMKVDFD